MNPVVRVFLEHIGSLKRIGIKVGQGCLSRHRKQSAGFLLCSFFVVLLFERAHANVTQSVDFKEIFNTHSAVMLLIDPATGRIVDANSAASKFYGYHPLQLSAMSIQQINTLTPEQVKRERQLADSEGRNYFIFRHKLASNEVRTVSVNSHPYAFSGKTLLLSVIHDITPGRHDAQAMWHYQSRLEEMVDQQVAEIKQVRQQKEWILWGGIAFQALVIIGLIFSIYRGVRLRRELSSQRESLTNIIWGTDVGTWEWNVRTGEAQLNARWAATLGYTLEELMPISIDTWWRFIHPEDIERSKSALQRHFSGESDAYQCEVRMHHKKGHWVWVLDRGKVVAWSEEGEPEWVSGTHTEVTDKKAAEESLLQAASVFEYANEGIMITGPDGTIQNANLALSNITGYDREEVIGKNPRVFSSGVHDDAYFKEMWKSLSEHGNWTNEIWNRRKDGEIFAAIQTVSAIKDESGKLIRYVSLFSDITALKQQQQQLEKIAHYDALTGLPNRVLLSDRLQQAILRTRRQENILAVAFFDLDGFKAINDSYGHSIGDRLLVELAERSKLSLREGDSLARLGGDEFIAVLPSLNHSDESLPVLERLLSAISKPLNINNLELSVTASIGITFFPQEDDIDADQLIRQADQAMYVAKQSGKNRFHVFDAEYDRSVRGQHDQLSRIHTALEQNEFTLFYQPKVNMRTGEVVGCEALIRWQHPENGLTAPADFLPIIEGNAELVVKVGEWVLEQAMAQISDWRQQNLALPVSVNIDGLHLQLPDFVHRLQEKLTKFPKVQPGDLELEVLETSALNDIKRVSGIINECREIGISFALDDFGTGYSSLTYLKQLPASLLKIDRSFVCDMLDDLEDLSILEGVLGLANAFRCESIAEGVESVEQGEMLLMLGCELAQGYVIAKPMPASGIPKFVATWLPANDWIGREPVNRDDLPFLFSLVEHRAWLRELQCFLDGENETPPQDRSNYCQFGQWLSTVDYNRYEDHLDLRQIRSLHEELHRQSVELIEHKQAGKGVAPLSMKQFESRFKELMRLMRSMLH